MEKYKRTKRIILRIAIEVGFIAFLFYSNLLMGEYVRSGNGRMYGLGWAFHNIFTVANFLIAVIAGFVGYVAFELLRRQF
jgi:hypothetical protein